jgi:O-acetyl-ADP-ribose deacetylase (regulator of RNase III)
VKKLTYVNDDILKTDCNIIGHGCNAMGAFGSGVAGLIGRFFPDARKAYMEKYYEKDLKLGDVHFVTLNTPYNNVKVIANMITQQYYGNDGAKYVSYAACERAFNKLFKYADANKMSVGMPKIGAGLGGGDWNLIEEKLKSCLKNYDVTVKVYYL